MNMPASKTFCVKAFGGISVTPSGACAPCCLFERMISDEKGQPFKIWQDDIDKINNSEFMREVRRKMLAGEAVDPCRQCYQVEAHGGVSLRMQANSTDYEMPDVLDPDFIYPALSLDLKLNNRCNLKCRMCQPRDSHLVYNEFEKISKTMPEFQFYSNANLTDPDLEIPLDQIPEWSNSEDFFEKLDRMLSTIRKIAIVGGEPLLLDEVYRLIDLCVERGVASNITLIFTTNLMHVPFEKLRHQLPKFKTVLFNISLDATGKELNYIRYPTVMSKVMENFHKLYSLREAGNMYFQFSPTVQVYNVLYLSDVYHMVEKLLEKKFVFTGAPVHLTYLEFPQHLNIRILPENVRRRAIEKLKRLYIEVPLLMNSPIVRANLNQLIQSLQKDSISHYDYLPEFLHYSQTLDKERGQRGEDFLPELFSFLKDIKPASPVEPFYRTRERGWRLAQQGKLAKAIEVFETSVISSPNKDLDYREMAWMNFELGRMTEAESLYRSAYSINPKDPVILKGLALTYSKAGKLELLKKLLPEACLANPQDPALLELQRMVENEA